MGKKSSADLAYSLFRLGLTAVLLSEQSKTAYGQASLEQYNQVAAFSNEGIRDDMILFPKEQAMVQQFRTANHPSRANGRQRLPKVKIDKVLRARAQADYEAARGTAHRQLLLDAEERLQSQAQDAQKRVAALQKEVDGLATARDDELRQAVVRPIVERELPALPGIGPRLANAILTHVFKGNLEDLWHASIVDGIGPQKQAIIDAWVGRQRERLPALLSERFPGKDEINARYNRQIGGQRLTLNRAEAYALDLRNVLERVYGELEWLIPIGPHDFELAFAEGEGQHEYIERYILGCFPPWEPMPDWFTAAIGIGTPQDKDIDIPIHIRGQSASGRSQSSSGLEDQIIIRER